MSMLTECGKSHEKENDPKCNSLKDDPYEKALKQKSSLKTVDIKMIYIDDILKLIMDKTREFIFLEYADGKIERLPDKFRLEESNGKSQ